MIFPEHDVFYNHIICDFQNRFVDVAKLYYKKTEKAVCFVPVYIAPKLKKMYLGKPVRFSPDEPLEEERTKICKHLMEEITAVAEAQPVHTVIPYQNISRKHYPKNIPGEETNEKTGG